MKKIVSKKHIKVKSRIKHFCCFHIFFLLLISENVKIIILIQDFFSDIVAINYDPMMMMVTSIFFWGKNVQISLAKNRRDE